MSDVILEWCATNNAGVAVAATATQAAAGAGKRNIARSLQFDLGGAVAFGVSVVVRDGAAGAGPIIWNGYMENVAAGADHISLTGLGLYGSPNTAMTIEFTGTNATAIESVSMTGVAR